MVIEPGTKSLPNKIILLLFETESKGASSDIRDFHFHFNCILGFERFILSFSNLYDKRSYPTLGRMPFSISSFR